MKVWSLKPVGLLAYSLYWGSMDFSLFYQIFFVLLINVIDRGTRKIMTTSFLSKWKKLDRFILYSMLKFEFSRGDCIIFGWKCVEDLVYYLSKNILKLGIRKQKQVHLFSSGKCWVFKVSSTCKNSEVPAPKRNLRIHNCMLFDVVLFIHGSQIVLVMVLFLKANSNRQLLWLESFSFDVNLMVFCYPNTIKVNLFFFKV